ncbi:hypothetical protein PVAP13_9NG840401 [Panicum virgatum]|uniref:Uncharacterized protein n=1 Tax=Panicum virgatum TaxID=38727 RepID=A0A8T0N5P1_PANVG|nr:hypothetical protein PVAP13_9NG840401 [Panicum virgatum]
MPRPTTRERRSDSKKPWSSWRQLPRAAPRSTPPGRSGRSGRPSRSSERGTPVVATAAAPMRAASLSAQFSRGVATSPASARGRRWPSSVRPLRPLEKTSTAATAASAASQRQVGREPG